MARRSASALILLAENLREVGEDPDPVLARFGLDPRHMDPTALLDRDLERRVNEGIAESLRDPLSAIRVGSSLGIGSYGPFTLLMLTAENVLADIRTAIEFQALTFLFGRLGFEPGRSRSSVVLRHEQLSGKALRFRVDLDVAGSCKLMRDLNRAAQVEVAPLRIVMPYRRPPEAPQYERVLGCPVAWDGREARIELANELLRKRFATSDPHAHRILHAQCRRLLLELEARSADVAARVRSHLSAGAGTFPTATEAATLLGMSERSLRRALKAEHTSYRSILEQVRREKAGELLKDARLPVEEIALRLGYSEPAAFIHAFKRWTGKSPALHRRESRDAASGRSSPTGDT